MGCFEYILKIEKQGVFAKLRTQLFVSLHQKRAYIMEV